MTSNVIERPMTETVESYASEYPGLCGLLRSFSNKLDLNSCILLLVLGNKFTLEIIESGADLLILKYVRELIAGDSFDTGALLVLTCVLDFLENALRLRAESEYGVLLYLIVFELYSKRVKDIIETGNEYKSTLRALSDESGKLKKGGELSLSNLFKKGCAADVMISRCHDMLGKNFGVVTTDLTSMD